MYYHPPPEKDFTPPKSELKINLTSKKKKIFPFFRLNPPLPVGNVFFFAVANPPRSSAIHSARGSLKLQVMPLEKSFWHLVPLPEIGKNPAFSLLGALPQHISYNVEDAKKLDQYYIPTRYPNGLPGDIPSRFFNDPKEAEDAMQLAKK